MTEQHTDLPAWISAFSAVLALGVGGVASFIGLRTYAHQRTSYDVNLALSIFSEINRYWDKVSEEVGDPSYNFGQVLAQFEVAAALFNDAILTTQAEKILGDHIVEVFSSLESSDSGKALIAHCQSSETTFYELRKFAKYRFPASLLEKAFGPDIGLTY